jgi:hypothetical protein
MTVGTQLAFVMQFDDQQRRGRSCRVDPSPGGGFFVLLSAAAFARGPTSAGRRAVVDRRGPPHDWYHARSDCDTLLSARFGAGVCSARVRRASGDTETYSHRHNRSFRKWHGRASVAALRAAVGDVSRERIPCHPRQTSACQLSGSSMVSESASARSARRRCLTWSANPAGWRRPVTSGVSRSTARRPGEYTRAARPG